jgi:hypothetical protein
MVTRKTRRIHKSLSTKGFNTSNNDHIWYILYVDGKKTSIRTKISHGKKEYDDSLLGKMAGQLRLSKNDLLELIDCPLSYEKYCDILFKKKIIRL